MRMATRGRDALGRSSTAPRISVAASMTAAPSRSRGTARRRIVAIFAGRVGLVRIASPQPGEVDAKIFAGSPRHNFIDGLVLKELESLNIPPSPQCADHEFIRRAYLDALGILPTPEEVQKFVSVPEASAKKRAKLDRCDSGTSEFVDYWAYKWSDLL